MVSGPDKDGSLVVNSTWHTGPGFNDGLAGTAYLLCWAADDEGHCAERVELPPDAEITWD